MEAANALDLLVSELQYGDHSGLHLFGGLRHELSALADDLKAFVISISPADSESDYLTERESGESVRENARLHERVRRGELGHVETRLSVLGLLEVVGCSGKAYTDDTGTDLLRRVEYLLFALI